MEASAPSEKRGYSVVSFFATGLMDGEPRTVQACTVEQVKKWILARYEDLYMEVPLDDDNYEVRHLISLENDMSEHEFRLRRRTPEEQQMRMDNYATITVGNTHLVIEGGGDMAVSTDQQMVVSDGNPYTTRIPWEYFLEHGIWAVTRGSHPGLRVFAEQLGGRYIFYAEAELYPATGVRVEVGHAPFAPYRIDAGDHDPSRDVPGLPWVITLRGTPPIHLMICNEKGG